MIATEKFSLIRAFSPPLSEIPRPADTISHKPNCIRRGNLSGFAIFFLTGNVSRETFCTEKFRKTLYKAKKSCYNKIVLVCVKHTFNQIRCAGATRFQHTAGKENPREYCVCSCQPERRRGKIHHRGESGGISGFPRQACTLRGHRPAGQHHHRSWHQEKTAAGFLI